MSTTNQTTGDSAATGVSDKKNDTTAARDFVSRCYDESVGEIKQTLFRANSGAKDWMIVFPLESFKSMTELFSLPADKSEVPEERLCLYSQAQMLLANARAKVVQINDL